MEFFQALKKDMKVDHKALYFHVQFILRRLFIVIIAFRLQAQPMLQLILTMILSLGTIVYIAIIKPFDSPSQSEIELFNEFLNLMVMDVYATIIGYATRKEDEVRFGAFLNMLIATILLGNMGLMTIISIKENLYKLKVYYAIYTKKPQIFTENTLGNAPSQNNSTRKFRCLKPE
jgi:hypothetical protein